MDFSIFDLIAGSIILLLGLKGILNGFFKELFGLIGIVGGIFVASRLASDVGGFLSNTFFRFESPAAISFLGFLVTLAVFWLTMLLAGSLFQKFSAMSGLGLLDKLLGFVFGSGKFFFIASVIVYAVYNFKAVRDNVDLEGSFLLPVMIETGRVIMHIDGEQIADDINTSIDKSIEGAKEAIKDDMTQEVLDTAAKEKEALMKAVNEKFKESNLSLPTEKR